MRNKPGLRDESLPGYRTHLPSGVTAGTSEKRIENGNRVQGPPDTGRISTPPPERWNRQRPSADIKPPMSPRNTFWSVPMSHCCGRVPVVKYSVRSSALTPDMGPLCPARSSTSTWPESSATENTCVSWLVDVQKRLGCCLAETHRSPPGF